MSKSLYFAYGSNLCLDQMKERCPDSEKVTSFTLKDYKLVFRTVADIEKSIDSGVEGVIFRISKKDEIALDRYEGVPDLYRKEYLGLGINGRIKKVLYYKMNIKGLGKPSNTYYRVIEKGYEQNNLNKKNLVKALEFSVKNRKDPIHISPRWKD